MALGEKLRRARLKKKLTASQVASATRMITQIVEAIEREDFSKVAAPIYAKGFIRMYAEQVGLDPKPLIDEYVSRFASPKPPFLMDETELFPSSKPPVPSGVETEMDKQAEPETPGPSLFGRISTFASSSLSALQRRLVEEEEPEQVETGPEQDETDLFSRIERGSIKLGARGESVGPKIDLSSVQSAAVKTIEAVADLSRKSANKFGEKLKSVTAALRQRGFNLPGVRFAESPLRYLSIILGILVVLVFLISSLYSCGGRRETGTGPAAAGTGQELRLAIEPPDSYLD